MCVPLNGARLGRGLPHKRRKKAHLNSPSTFSKFLLVKTSVDSSFTGGYSGSGVKTSGGRKSCTKSGYSLDASAAVASSKFSSCNTAQSSVDEEGSKPISVVSVLSASAVHSSKPSKWNSPHFSSFNVVQRNYWHVCPYPSPYPQVLP